MEVMVFRKVEDGSLFQMEEYNEKQLSATAVKMFTHGAGYDDIRTFLKRHCEKDMEDRIVQTVVQLETDHPEAIYEKRIEISKGPKQSFGAKVFYKCMSALMLVGGASFFFYYHSARGKLIVLPIVIAGLGLYGLLNPKNKL